MNKYDDIICLPHHISKYYPRMSLEQRSAQFAPFDALEGYSDEVKETERLTSKRIILDEEAQEKGYESNQEYYADYVLEDEELEDKAHIERIFETYLDYWLGNDGYYVGYETMYNWIGKTLVVSVAYMWSV